ncbi:MAG: Zn-dependent hydrolase, glyoxylase [Chloroflexi bacterium]|nr:Zn-dependent hydrolase, glyoxylase [Chloroflexota bacterium]
MTIEEVAPSLFRVEVPIPDNPLQSVNSYFLKSRDRNLIIDTGMNLPECRLALSSAISALQIDLNKTDFFVTHLHADHLALALHMASKNSRLYLNRTEFDLISSPNGWEMYHDFYLKYGFPDDSLHQSEQHHPAKSIKPELMQHFTPVEGDETFLIGDYAFQCISTPGHSPGHLCLYEPSKKILISGDHILFDITPNINSWPIMENALKEYLLNLDKVFSLDVELVLPGHRSIQTNHRRRIQGLKEHHRTRANEVLAILEHGKKTAYQVAPLMTWDVSYASWERFPIVQKWFAVGEALAHLKYLEAEGEARSQVENGTVLFYKE